MSWQESSEYRHLDLTHDFLGIPLENFDYYGSEPSNFTAWNSGYQDLSSNVSDPPGANALYSTGWTYFDDGQGATHNEGATEDTIPIIEGQTADTEPSIKESDLREVRQQVSQLKESLEILQKSWEEYKERLRTEIAADVKKIEEWNTEIKKIVSEIAREAKSVDPKG